MPLLSRVKLLVAVWAVLEAVAFVAVVRWIGLGAALGIGLLTTLAGAGLLKRVGSAAVLRLRSGLSRRGGGSGEVLDGALQAVAALALLLPGFLGDLLGLALAVPFVRAAAIRRIAGLDRRRRFAEPGARHGPDAIDLSPDEWSSAPRPPGRATPRP